MNKIFFDIETVKGTVNINPDDLKAPSNYKSAEAIAKYQQAKAQEIEAKAGLNSFTAKICCIGYAVNDDPAKYIVGINEQEVLTKFADALEVEAVTWIGYNILAFDLPFIYHRAIKYGLKGLKNMLPQDSRQYSYDVMKKISPTDYASRVSLKDAALYFGLENPKNKMSGADVQSYYDAGRFDEIGQYCLMDVEITRNLYNLITK